MHGSPTASPVWSSTAPNCTPPPYAGVIRQCSANGVEFGRSAYERRGHFCSQTEPEALQKRSCHQRRGRCRVHLETPAPWPDYARRYAVVPAQGGIPCRRPWSGISPTARSALLRLAIAPGHCAPSGRRALERWAGLLPYSSTICTFTQSATSWLSGSA